MTHSTETSGRDLVKITCAPRYNHSQDTITIPRGWLPLAKKLVDVGQRRFRLPHPSVRTTEASRLREATWDEIRQLWHNEAQQTTMPASVAMQLLGLSRQAFYNILNYEVGDNQSEVTNRPPAVRGTAYIRAWARNRGIDVPDYGIIPRSVREAYLEEMGEG